MSLDAFKNLFSKKADANIERINKKVAKYNAKLAEFNEIWPIAMAEAENAGMGETFVKMFPEGGGFGGGDPFQGISTEYTNLLEYGDPLKPLVKKLYKLENSAERLKTTKGYLKQAIKYKEDGADAYILKIRQGIGGLIAGLSNPDKGWDNFIKFGDKFLEDPEGEDSPIEGYSRSFKQAIDGPSGVLSSTELFLAVKEQGNPVSKISEEPEDDAKGEESTAINSNVEIEPEETGSEELITPEESAETGETIETDVKTIQEALSIPKEVEQPDKPEDPKETVATSPINQDTETKETPEESLDQTELGKAPVSKEAVAIPASETSQSPISQSEQTPIEQVDSQLQSIPEVESPTAAEQAVSPIGNEKPKKIPFFKKIKNALSQEGGVISNISNVLNSAGDFLQDGSISNLISNNVTSESNLENNTINQSGDIIGNIKDQVKSKQDKVLGKESSVSNLSETFLNQDFSKAGDVVKNTNLGGAVSNVIDKSSSLSPFPKSEIIKPEPITKADISEVGENISTNVSSSITPSPPIQEPVNNSTEISGKERREAKREARQENRDEKKAARGMTSINNDFSSLEKRLKNIELLLMGPLEVKIKN